LGHDGVALAGIVGVVWQRVGAGELLRGAGWRLEQRQGVDAFGARPYAVVVEEAPPRMFRVGGVRQVHEEKAGVRVGRRAGNSSEDLASASRVVVGVGVARSELEETSREGQ